MSKYLSYREPLYAHRKGESWGPDRKRPRECLGVLKANLKADRDKPSTPSSVQEGVCW